MPTHTPAPVSTTAPDPLDAGVLVDLAAGLAAAVPGAVVPRQHTLVGLFFAPEEPHDYEEAKRSDTERFARFFHAMLRRGVALAPGAYEILFPGLAHTDEVIDQVLDATSGAVADLDLG